MHRHAAPNRAERPQPAPALSADAILALQRTAGNQAVQRLARRTLARQDPLVTREDPLGRIRFDRNDPLQACLIAEASRRTDLHSEERLRYALRLAHACKDVYASFADARGDTDRTGLTRIDDEGLVDLGLNPDDFNDRSGYQAALYVDRGPLPETQCREFEGREPESRYVLANRGTDISSPADWSTNFRQGVGLNSRQHQVAVRLARQVYDRVGGRITFTGHSLGGGLASAQSLETGAPAVTFNAAGLDRATIEPVSSPGAGGHRIAAYHVDDDVLSLMQDNPLLMQMLAGPAALELDPAVGRRAVLSSERGGVIGALMGIGINAVITSVTGHLIDSVIASLERALAESGAAPTASGALSRTLARSEPGGATSLDPDRVAAERERDGRVLLPASTNHQLVERALRLDDLVIGRGLEARGVGPLTRAAYAQTLMVIHGILAERFATASLTEDALPDLPPREYPRRTDSPVDPSSPLAGIVEDIPPFGNIDLWAGLAGDVPRAPRRRRPPPPPGPRSVTVDVEGDFDAIPVRRWEDLEETLPARPYTPEPERPDMPRRFLRGRPPFLEGLGILLEGYENGINTAYTIAHHKAYSRGFAETLGRLAAGNRDTPPDQRFRSAPSRDSAHIIGLEAYREGERAAYAHVREMDATLPQDEDDGRRLYPSTAYLEWVRLTYGNEARQISNEILRRHVPEINAEASEFQQPETGGDTQ